MSAPSIDHAWYQRAFPGESLCGDKAAAFPAVDGYWLVLADGIGHGPRAHNAAARAVAIVERVASAGARLVDAPPGTTLTTSRVSLPALFVAIHQSLQETVGAALGIAHIACDTGIVHFAGVGNTLLRRIGSADTRMVSRDGIVGQPGQRAVVPRPVEMALVPGDLLLFTSDGVEDHFGPTEYPGILSQNAAQVSRTVVERFSKPHDDATCLALRYTP